MCVPPTLRFYGVGGVALFAEITAAAIPVWGCCSFFYFSFPGSYPPGCSGLETSDCPLVVSKRFPEAGV